MKVAARRIAAQRPMRRLIPLPRREAEGITEDGADIRLRSARARRERNFDRAAIRTERTGLRCPVEIAERPGESMEVMLRAVAVSQDGVEIAHESSAATASAIRLSTSAI